jgi:hypothetical protein
MFVARIGLSVLFLASEPGLADFPHRDLLELPMPGANPGRQQVYAAMSELMVNVRVPNGGLRRKTHFDRIGRRHREDLI